jgi:hypothetical protein
MTEMEYAYLQRAVDALNSPTISDEDRVKILRTMAQICGKCATEINSKIQQNLVDSLAV